MSTRDFSKVACRVWRSKKFQKLPPEGRLFYLYLLTCPHSSSAGLFILPLGYVCHDMGLSPAEVDNCIQMCVNVDLIGYDDDEQAVYIKGWFEVNPPTNANHAKKVVSEVMAMPDCEVKAICVEELTHCLNQKQWEAPPELDTLSKGYKKGIDRVEKGFRHSDSDSTQTETETKTQTARVSEPVESVDKSGVELSSGAPVPSKNTVEARAYNIAEHLQGEQIEEAKLRVPGWDILYVINTYNDLVGSGEYALPNNPAAAFIKFCEGFYRKRGRPK